MFQNIAEEEKIEEIITEGTGISQKLDIKQIAKKLFTKQNILVYILSFMLSTVSTINGITPFGIAIFTATFSCGLPCGIIFILGMIGTMIGMGGGQALTYMFTALVFTLMVLLFKPWYQEEYKSERRKVGKYVIISVMLVQIVQMLFKGFLLYDLFVSIETGVVTYIFYKIFSNSLTTISEYGITKAFTVEEVVGASLMLAIATCAFKNISIFGFEIRTVLSILIVLILGWKQGILIRSNKWNNNRCCTRCNWWRNIYAYCFICFIGNDSRFFK